jgi:pantetheine-phosphate adenylyltransferase
MTRVAVFPGSFDPMTNAHLDVAGRAATLFDRLVIGVLNNARKEPLFSVDERVELIGRCVAGLGDHVTVDSFDGLTVDFARRHGAGFVVRGLRAVSDFEAELQMALTNRKLAPEVDTTFLMTALEYGYVSSTLAKEVARFGGDVTAMVPEPVGEALTRRIGTRPSV